MKIGIIGAGLSGLVAGKILARAGHDVVVFEKSRGYGGRMATRRIEYNEVVRVDHGASYLSGHSETYLAFLKELEEHGLVSPWTDHFSCYADGRILPELPGRERTPHYIAPDGMNSIGKYLGRTLDICFGEQVGGITHIGGSRTKKSPWMLHTTSINVFEADAVIVATPAIQAYGLISTSQDEYDLRKMISTLDRISYSSAVSLFAGYGKRTPAEWKAIQCDHPAVSWICNESSKRDYSGDTNLVVHSTDRLAKQKAENSDDRVTAARLLDALGEILGTWASRPEWYQLHFWRYHLPRKSLDMPYLESKDAFAPIALIGDYFQGRSMEAAYLSGLALGTDWVKKFT